MVLIGCSKWCKAEQYQHRYLAIPPNVDEDLFLSVWNNGGVFPDSARTLRLTDKCALTLPTNKTLPYCRTS